MAFLDSIAQVLSRERIRVGDEAELAAFGTDRTRIFPPRPSAVLLPESSDEVARIVEIARRFRQPLVPSGGRTGYAGGAVAREGEVVVAFDRMKSILSFDPWLPALTVQAGVTTREVQEEARSRNLFFPVDFASAGSSQIGGNLASHAGGIRVLRYGTIRRYAIGLTAVTGRAEILRFPGSILKNNTGYDLKELLIGSEGTLALITEATLRLVPPPPESMVILCSMNNIEQVLDSLSAFRSGGIDLMAFEIFDRACLDLVLSHRAVRSPFVRSPEWTVLAELPVSGTDPAILESLPGEEILPAEAPSLKASFWALREGISEALSLEGPLHKNDVSLPPGSYPHFIEEARSLANRECPGARIFFFGHAGDGNLHLNILSPPDLPEDDFRSRMRRFDEQSYALIRDLGGSISAEHGIGLLKRDSLVFSRNRSEIRIMREIKRVFDPEGILNPGKIFPLETESDE